MAYIIAVNSSVVSDTGGTCICPPTSLDACATDITYNLCKQEIRRDLVTATAAISALTSFCMGLFANLPLGLAPGMGINAYFTYTVVGFNGTGLVPYRIALTAVFVEGLLFVALTILGIRQWLARAIPASIKLATGVGIGLYLTIIGFSYSAGIGLITGASSTPLEIAGCSQQYLTENDGLMCDPSYKMRSPTMWIGIFCGGFLTVFLMMFRVKGAIIAGILLVSIISWPRGTDVTYFPHTELGDSNFDFFKNVVTFRPIKNILAAQEWDVSSHGGQFGLALITFLYVDILDCTGTLYAMARFAGVMDEKTQDFEGSATAYLVDAVGISIGSLFGTSPVTAFIESGAGISEGGKTGIAAMVTGICFFISVFFAPIFASIPPWATGCTLVIIGSLMAKAAADINWRYMGDAIPAFLTIAIMPFTYSIAYGLIAGIMSYILINTTVWLVEKAGYDDAALLMKMLLFDVTDRPRRIAAAVRAQAWDIAAAEAEGLRALLDSFGSFSLSRLLAAISRQCSRQECQPAVIDELFAQAKALHAILAQEFGAVPGPIAMAIDNVVEPDFTRTRG
ncbi:MAG: NCS2 family permease [Oxalobacteraceae bacterium]|nr:MAG: NCS2 family permease [Oxalobacteraceae bacterium]